MINVEKILIIRRGAIGDIIFTLPAYYMLKANFPNAKFSYLVKDNYSFVLKGFPDLDQIIPIQNEILASKKIISLWKMSTQLLHTIRKNHFQLVVDFAGHGEQAFLLRLSGIKHRWGLIKSRKPLRSLLYTNTLARQTHGVHLIDQHLKLLEQGGLTRFPVKNEYIVPSENLDKAKALFNRWELSLQKPTVFIQPFTGDGIEGKIWPLERYVLLVEYWKKRGVQVLFGGGPREAEKLKDIATRFPVAAGQSDFVTSVGLAKLSSIVVGGDTGLMHAALAVGKRTVMIVGPTNYQLIGPYRHPEWVVKPQKGNLIEDISVEQVLEATKTAFNDTLIEKIR